MHGKTGVGVIEKEVLPPLLPAQNNLPTTAIAQYPEADDGKSNKKVDRPQMLNQAYPWLHGSN